MRYFTLGDPPSALLKASEPGDVDVGYFYLDKRTGEWVDYPEVGHSIITGDADAVTEATAKRIAQTLIR